MPSLKDLRVRITSVKSTQKITSAMKMVAAAKLKRAQVAAEQGRPYAQSMERMLANLLGSIPSLEHAPKLLAGHGTDQKHLLVVITSDRGLAGGFNANIAREARRRMNALQRDGKEVKLLMIGRKGRDALAARPRQADHRRAGKRHAQRRAVRAGPRHLAAIAKDVRQRRVRRLHADLQYLQVGDDADRHGEADHSLAGRRTAAGRRAATPQDGVYEMEPEEDELLRDLLPANLSMQIFRALLESYASEQGARMTAMDNATRNAGDMIDRLTLTYNRSRQAAITRELIEIISGAEAV